MSKEVTEIINTLCEKLGVAANILVPELAKYNIARLVFQTAIYTVMAIAVAIFITKIVKFVMSNDEDDFDDKAFQLFLVEFIPIVIFVIFFGLAVSNATNLIGWIASPTASAVKEITSIIK